MRLKTARLVANSVKLGPSARSDASDIGLLSSSQAARICRVNKLVKGNIPAARK